MLEIDGIDVFRGENQILKDISLTVGKGEVVALLGANGAGKSTLLETIIGVHHPKKGSIQFESQRIELMPSYRLAAAGIGCVPEGRRIFSDMTVQENLEMGAYLPRVRLRCGANLAWVYSLFPKLEQRRNQVAGTLSGGEQQMVAIGRALMGNPRLLLLDELSLGLSPKITREIFSVIDKIRSDDMGILLIEQNVFLALRHSQRGYVLENGKISLKDSSERLLLNDHINRAYLGL